MQNESHERAEFTAFRASHDLRGAIGRALEDGVWGGVASRWLSHAWAHVASRSIARPFSWPEGTQVFAIAGATLGGSGATPLAIACARVARESGARVAFVSHAYRARPREPRVVLANDSPHVVGDEALIAHRALADLGIDVIVAPNRRDAVTFAATRARTVIVDGALQARPSRVALSLLAVDAENPWGRGAPPPRGDLRAPVDSLRGASDLVVRVGAMNAIDESNRDEHAAHISIAGARIDGRDVALSDLALLRVGVVTALARPRRVISGLARSGITPYVTRFAADHAPMSPRIVRELARLAVLHRLDAWIACEKAEIALLSSREALAVPLATLRRTVRLSPALADRILAATTAKCSSTHRPPPGLS